MEDDELLCEVCNWTGNVNDLIDDRCPECGSKEIVDNEPEEDYESDYDPEPYTGSDSLFFLFGE